jgi:hypothetical protein
MFFANLKWDIQGNVSKMFGSNTKHDGSIYFDNKKAGGCKIMNNLVAAGLSDE